MKLLHATLRPGRVLEVLNRGEVKVEAPGLFSKEDKERLPKVYPFFGGAVNSYSSPKEGDDIWVLNLEDNPVQLYWFRRDRREDNEKLEGEENVEILCNRPAGTGWATLYFSDGSGWILRNGESVISIDRNGDILLDTHKASRYIRISRNGIILGGEEHEGARGDVVQDLLETLATCLSTIRSVAATNPYTLAISSAIGSTPEKIASGANKVSSPHIKIA